jgi:hypothetical protein
MIPATFNEEIEFLSDFNSNSLKRRYMTFYWKARKDFLNDIEDSISHHYSIGSTISTRSKKSFSCSRKISSPSVLSHDTKTLKHQRNPSHMIFTLETSITHFYSNLTLRHTGTMLRTNLKKIIFM